MKKAKTLVSFLSIAGLSMLAAGCGGSDTSNGTLQMHLTDAPACGFNAVNVTVSKIRIHESGNAEDNDGGWYEIVPDPAKSKFNLLDLTNGVMATLGQTSLPAGRYTQIRLVLAENSGTGTPANSVVLENTTNEIELKTPSGQQSGLKLKGDFDIAANATTDLVLDFDACKSVVKQGNSQGGSGYLLKPVITVIPKATSGGITGFVTPGQTGTVVTAQQNGVVIKSTVPDSTGAFKLSPMPPSGTADYVVVITADGRTTAAVTGVPVTTGVDTTLNTSSAPIALSTPVATQTVSGTISPASAQAVVSATQTFAAGPKIEVKFAAADAGNGTYSMTLPSAAPLLATFNSAASSIAFTADTSIAGKYTLGTVASGYAAQSAAIDVSAGNVTRDFALAP